MHRDRTKEILGDRQKRRNPVGSSYHPFLPLDPTNPLPLPIFSVELIRSMRAPGRAARHAGTVSICEPTQTGSPGARLLRAHTYAFLYACTHTYANVSPRTG